MNTNTGLARGPIGEVAHLLRAPTSDVFQLQGSSAVFRPGTPPPGEDTHPAPGGRRGVIRDISAASRRRLQFELATWDWQSLSDATFKPRFVTLTTPPESWADRLGVYRAFRRLSDRIRFHFPQVAFVHVYEYGGKSGALHLHLLILGAEGWTDAALTKWFRSAWTDCLGWSGMTQKDGRRMETLICRAETIRSLKHAASYVCKYVSKGSSGEAVLAAEPEGSSLSKVHSVGIDAETPDLAAPAGECRYTGGKWWGLHNEAAIPYAPVLRCTGEDALQSAVRVRRIVRKLFIQRALARFAKTPLGAAYLRDACNVRRIERLIRSTSAYYRILSGPMCAFSFFGEPSQLEALFKAAGVLPLETAA